MQQDGGGGKGKERRGKAYTLYRVEMICVRHPTNQCPPFHNMSDCLEDLLSVLASVLESRNLYLCSWEQLSIWF